MNEELSYNEILDEDINRQFYHNHPDFGTTLIARDVSLKNAIARLQYHEYYVLVTYKEDEQLPSQYVPCADVENFGDTLFATINPNVQVHNLCYSKFCKNGIQTITNINLPGESPNYLLGPGPDKVSLEELIEEQRENYISLHKKKDK